MSTHYYDVVGWKMWNVEIAGCGRDSSREVSALKSSDEIQIPTAENSSTDENSTKTPTSKSETAANETQSSRYI